MNTRASRIIAAAFLSALTISLAAQTGIETGSPFGKGEDSIRCQQNTSLYEAYYLSNDLSLALSHWRQVLAECPASSEDVYIKGESMYRELYKNSGDRAYIDTVLMILSQRTLNFNNEPANNLRKSLALFELGENDTVYAEQCFYLLNEVADSFPDYFDHSHSVLLMAAASRSYSFTIIDTASVLTAYLKARGIVEKQLQLSPKDEFLSDAANKIDSIFMASGAMTCSSIETLYSQKVDKDIRDTVLINKVFGLLAEKNCINTDFYYRIATKLFAVNRSAQNAIRLAELNIARNNKDKAVWYFSEAYKIDTNKIVQSDVLTRVAAMELAAGKRQEARNHGEQAWELNNKNGKALFIIAEAYAGSKIGDAFDDHSAYWVAVDYLKSAREADPSLKGIADEKIKAYSKLFPTREEGYYRGITDEGIVYRVGGWINEVTIIRFRKE